MAKTLRCAIYTRKSTEEGLEQDFNSLDAQREACSAYILSQRHEGWRECPELYDDGGFSGGSMERPALKRLLAEIEARSIDVVVVYKVDRLTRSLTDFARMVQIFDAADVSFVSVTQQFNTTTSMGRLTLNVLLSFAQFEREVTAERIRDKIAASKAKGMWMGGVPPIGYRAENRKLVVDADQAEIVCRIFERYLSLGSVRLLQAELKRDGVLTPLRTSRSGQRSGGCAFSRGKLYAMLSNPVYIGKVRHRDKTYEGQHDPIIDAGMWEQVETRLATNRRSHNHHATADNPSPLASKLFDPAGERMRPMHTKKKGKRYRYYVSPSLVESSVAAGARGWRLPAEEVETTLAKLIAEALRDPETITSLLEAASALSTDIPNELDRMRTALQAPLGKTGKAMLQTITQRVDLTEGELRASVEVAAALRSDDRTPDAGLSSFELCAPIRLARRGAELKLILQGAAHEAGIPDPNLVQLLLDSRRRRRAYLNAAAPMTISQIADDDDLDAGDVSRSMQLAYLAPDIVRAILDGRQPAELTATRLARLHRLPLLWKDQRAALNM